jgi:putative ABC transport system substrate-binding protein
MREDSTMRLSTIGLLVTFGIGLLWMPLVVAAQQPNRMRSIGVVGNFDTVPVAFLEEIQSRGWKEGRNVHIEVRNSTGLADRARTVAAEVVGLHPDVIWAEGVLALTELQKATRTIPIVFVAVSDPVGQGFVTSLARPSGNITGFTLFEFSQAGKWLEALKDMAPSVARVALVFSPDNPNSVAYLRSIEALAPSFPVQTMRVPVLNSADIERALSTFAREGSGGLIVLPAGIWGARNRKVLIELAAHDRLPAIYIQREFASEGGLLSYFVNLGDQYRKAAEYVDRLLRGAKPVDLPVQRPTKFELVINLKTAKALGLTVPPTLLILADEVIQ